MNRKSIRRRMYLVYLVILLAGLVVLWRFVPREVIEAVKTTYLNPDAAAQP